MNKCKEMRIRINRPRSVASYQANVEAIKSDKRTNMLFDAIDADVQDKEKFVVSQSRTIAEMKVDVNRMNDFYKVLEFVHNRAAVLGNAQPSRNQMKDIETTMNPTMSVGTLPIASAVEGGVQIAFLAGSIREGEQERMTRMLFRVTRGKALTYY